MKGIGFSIVKPHLTGTYPKIKQMFRWPVIGFIAGLWLSLEEANCQDFSTGVYAMSYCYNTSSVRTCFAPLFSNNNNPVHNQKLSENVSASETIKAANRRCRPTVPDSSLIVINILESQRTVDIFIGKQVLVNGTIVMDAQRLSANVSFERLWVKGHQPEQRDGQKRNAEASTTPGEDGRKKKRDAKHFRVGDCVKSEDGQSMSHCAGYDESQDHYICEYSDQNGHPNYSSDKQCICTNPQSTGTYNGKWLSCDCSNNYCIVCSEAVTSTTTATGITRETASTSPRTQKPSNMFPDDQTPASTSPRTQEPSNMFPDDQTPASTSPRTQKPSNMFPDDQSPATASTSSSKLVGLFDSINTNEILVILLLLVAAAFIVVAVIVIIRKRKYARRYETSPLNRTDQNEAVGLPRGCEIMVRDNRPSGDNIYTESEMTQQPTLSNSTTYASIPPTSEVINMGKSVDYTDIDFPLKDQQKPMSADKGTVSVSPIYSQPFETPSSDSNTDYVEPYKPDVKPTATAPVLNPQNTAVDQQNVYSLAKAIPLGDPNVIYSEPNKQKKSSTPTGEEIKVTDPVYLNVIEVKPGAGSEGVAKQDPSPVYAEPMKLKKSP